MTLESPPFCPHCGEPLSPNVDYCPRCGQDVLAPAAAPPAAAPPEPPPSVTVLDDPSTDGEEIGDAGPTERRAGRRTALLAVGAVAAVAVGGTAWALLRGGDDADFWADRLAQPAAVTTTPEVAWTWTGPDISGVTTAGSTTYVGADDGVHALDARGEEKWTLDSSGPAWVLAPIGSSDYVLALDFERGTVTALDPDDGSERWATEGDVIDAVGDRVLLRTDDGVRAVDATTGAERWTATTGSAAQVGPGAVYVVDDDDRLRRLDLEDGSEVWATDLDAASTASGYGAITVADGFVVAAGTGRVEAFDADRGAPRWSVEIDVPADSFGPLVGLASRTTVFVWGEQDGRAVIRDERGRIGTLPSDGDGFYAYGVHGADDYLLTGDGTVYDSDLVRVGGPHPRLGAATRDGVYEIGAGTLSFSRFTATEPAWEVEIDDGDRHYVTAGDRQVLVVGTDEVVAYR